MAYLEDLLLRWPEWRDLILNRLLEWATSPKFYGQAGAIVLCFLLAPPLAAFLKRRLLALKLSETGPALIRRAGRLVESLTDLMRPIVLVALLAVAATVADAALGASWLVRLAQSAVLVWLLYEAINRYITHPILRSAAIWVGIPVATLQVFGWYDDVIRFLDSISFSVGNIRLSLYFIIKAGIFGAAFFWIGRVTSEAGRNAIQRQESLDRGVRELATRLFEIALYVVIFLLLLQVLGVDLTALAILGGAVGVGLGFGLQQIAANFISGIIVLLERSIVVGDYVELEDGKAGIVKQINIRSTVLETFDGKEIVVPNERFITQRFVNWTHDDPRQRYEVEFTVAYDTDLHAVPPIIEKAVLKHPRVLREPEMPDCELRAFGDHGVKFAVEFWVKGLDDGPNKFSSDVLFLVWDALKENGIRIPYPRREVVLLNDAARKTPRT
jgi:small-conductance mechanosensitive channel